MPYHVLVRKSGEPWRPRGTKVSYEGALCVAMRLKKNDPDFRIIITDEFGQQVYPKTETPLEPKQRSLTFHVQTSYDRTRWKTVKMTHDRDQALANVIREQGPGVHVRIVDHTGAQVFPEVDTRKLGL